MYGHCLRKLKIIRVTGTSGDQAIPAWRQAHAEAVNSAAWSVVPNALDSTREITD